MSILETSFANIWNRTLRLGQKSLSGGSDLGLLVIDGRVTSQHYFLPQAKRTEHLIVLGKTGSGKTRLLLKMCLADIAAGRGFVFFDHHGDTVPLLLSAIAAEEQQSGQDFSERLVLIDPSDPDWSVGINVLGAKLQNPFVEIVAVAGILKERWSLVSFGAPTEELLRNSLHVLSENGLSLTELAPLLTDATFRRACLKKVSNPEISDYWQLRFEPMSEAMKAVRRDPVLNKVSEFVSDPHFRHIVGQAQSTVDFGECLDQGKWVLVNLSKGRLGRHSSTLGSLILSQLRPAIFRRQTRKLFSLYCDEIQNLVVEGSNLDVLLSESRKFAVSIVTANQYVDQLPKELRAAAAAVGTHIYFQLSADDAQGTGKALDGGTPLAEILKNLPQRHFVAKSGHYRFQQVEVPQFDIPAASFSSLLSRSRQHFARKRSEIEQEIRSRRPRHKAVEEALHDWE